MLWDDWTTTKCVKMVVTGLDVSVSQAVTPYMPHTTTNHCHKHHLVSPGPLASQYTSMIVFIKT